MVSVGGGKFLGIQSVRMNGRVHVPSIGIDFAELYWWECVWKDAN